MPTNQDDSKLITVYTGNLVDAEMIKNRLIEAGISASMKNQLMSSIAPWQISAGGFEPAGVMVFQEDKEKALMLIEEFKGSEM